MASTAQTPLAPGLGAYSKLLESLAGLLGPAPRSSSQWIGFGRLDWSVAERHRFTFEATGARLDSPGGGFTRASETYGTHSFGAVHATEQWALGRWEAFLTPNLLAVTQGSYGHQVQSATAETPSAFEQSLNINAWGQLPQIVVDPRYGFTIGNPARFGPGSYPDEHLTMVQEQLNWVRGNLMVKAGVEISHNTDATSRLRNQTGTYYYSSVEDFASDALAFSAYGLNGQLNPMNQHNCDQTGKAWRDAYGCAPRSRLPAVLLLLLADHGTRRLVAQHQRLGGLPDFAMAADKASRPHAGHALGTGTASTCNLASAESRPCRSPSTCPASAISGVRASGLPGAQARAAGR